MKGFGRAVMGLVFSWFASGCSELPEAKQDKVDERLTGVATLTVTGLPEGASVVTLSWFPGIEDDHFQGEIYPYSDGMEIPAGKVMVLIEGKGYESLLARRIRVYGNTVLTADMCKLGEGCYGTLKDIRSTD